MVVRAAYSPMCSLWLTTGFKASSSGSEEEQSICSRGSGYGGDDHLGGRSMSESASVVAVPKLRVLRWRKGHDWVRGQE